MSSDFDRARLGFEGGVYFLLAIFLLTLPCRAHVGSPNVFFAGKAGPYPVRVVVRPPGVIPGLAEISIRTESAGVTRISVLPVFWRAGKQGSPPPDVAVPVRGETNLHSATLWLMSPGAYSVNVTVEGAAGVGSVIVPVNAVAFVRREMAPWVGWTLAALGVFLFLAAVKLFGAAVSEAIQTPGVELQRHLRLRSRVAMAAAMIFLVGMVLGGQAWWDAVDRDYRSNRLFQSLKVLADLRTEREQPILRLKVDDPNPRRSNWTPIIPDHGKLMHLFLMREPALDAFAHLHPVQRDAKTFEVAMPPLPAGAYRVYADVTHESGFAQTLLGLVQLTNIIAPELAEKWKASARDPFCSTPINLAANSNLFLAFDPDDSWHIGSANGTSAITLTTQTSALAGGYTMIWERPASLAVNRELSLHFKLIAPNGQPAQLEPYIGMFGHVALRRNDGTVFTHLHPVGSFSMASQQSFERRERGTASVTNFGGKWERRAVEVTKATNAPQPLALLPAPAPENVKPSESHAQGFAESVAFPYEFPQPGSYRLWVQVKSGGRVVTGVFDAEIAAAK